MRYRTVEFKSVDGRDVPCQPWPQVFYIAGWIRDRDIYEVRPLTLAGFAKGVGKNLVTMTYWRLMVTVRILGFLKTQEFERLSWRHFTPRFWQHQMWWRLRAVRIAKSLARRIRTVMP